MGGQVGDNASRVVVGDTGDQQLSVAAAGDPVFVEKHYHAQSASLLHPLFHPGVILVVAGDEVAAVDGSESSQRRHVESVTLDGPVGEIAGEGDEVHVEIVDNVDDGGDEAALDRWPYVNVGDLSDSESLQGGGEAVDGYGHIDNGRASPGRVQPAGGKRDGQAEDPQVESQEQLMAGLRIDPDSGRANVSGQ